MTHNATTPVLSVVVVTWNGKEYALECLESLRNHSCRVAVQITVVDNASTDGTPEAIAALYPDVTLLRQGRNLGFAQANNIGIAVSTGAYVALINSDVVVPPGCLDNILDYMELNRDVGLLGPRMLSPTGGLGQSVYRLPSIWNFFCAALALHRIFPHSKRLGGYDLRAYPYDKTEDVEVLTGWFWVVPRRALEDVGQLDERFFMYGEDLDWSFRFQQRGWRVVFFAGAEALHYGAASSAADPTRFHLEKVIANSQYFAKHYGWTGRMLFLLITTLHEFLRICGHALAWCLPRRGRSLALSKIKISICSLMWLLLGRRPRTHSSLATVTSS